MSEISSNSDEHNSSLTLAKCVQTFTGKGGTAEINIWKNEILSFFIVKGLEEFLEPSSASSMRSRRETTGSISTSIIETNTFEIDDAELEEEKDIEKLKEKIRAYKLGDLSSDSTATKKKNLSEKEKVLRKRNMQAFLLIKSTLTLEVRKKFIKIPDGNTYAYYTAICDRYQAKTAATKDSLRNLLYNDKLSKSEDIDTLISRMEGYVMALRDLESLVSDDEFRHLFYKALPNEYAPSIAQLKVNNTQDFDVISQRLIEAQLDIRVRSGKNADGSAMAIYQNNNNSHKNSNNNHHKNKNQNNNKSGNSNSKTTCFSCGKGNHRSTECRTDLSSTTCPICNKIGHNKMGHEARDAIDSKHSKNRNNSSSSTPINTGNHAAICAHDSAYMVGGNTKNSIDLILDSAATKSLTPHRQALTNVESTDTINFGTVGSQVVSANEKGLMKLKVTNTNCTVSFSDFHYCPESRVNLLSVHQLRKNGCNVYMYNDKSYAIIETKAKTKIFVPLIGDLYILRCTSEADIKSITDDKGQNSAYVVDQLRAPAENVILQDLSRPKMVLKSALKTALKSDLYCSKTAIKSVSYCPKTTFDTADQSGTIQRALSRPKEAIKNALYCEKIAIKGVLNCSKSADKLNISTLQTTTKPTENVLSLLTDNTHAITESQKWHYRYAHLSKSGMENIIKHSAVTDLNLSRIQDLSGCISCAHAKAKRKSFAKYKTIHVNDILHRIDADLCGPIKGGTGVSGYMLVIVDVYSRMVFIFILDHKDEAEDVLINFINKEENLTGKKLKTFLSDQGGEFVSNRFKTFLIDKGVNKITTMTAISEANAIVERMNGIIMQMVRAMLLHANLPDLFWRDAAITAGYIRNRCTTKGSMNGEVTPYQTWFGRVPSVSNLRTFGSDCFIYDEHPEFSKISARSKKGIFIGYDDEKGGFAGYKCYELATTKTIISRHVDIHENVFTHAIELKQILSLQSSDYDNVNDSNEDDVTSVDLLPDDGKLDRNSLLDNEIKLAQIVSLEDYNNRNITTSTNISSDEQKYGIQNDVNTVYIKPTTSKTKPKTKTVFDTVNTNNILDASAVRSRTQANRSYAIRDGDYGQEIFLLSTGISNEHVLSLTESIGIETPNHYAQAIKSKQASKWLHAMQIEYDALLENNTWEIVDLPDGKHAIGCRWVYKIKLGPDGEVDKYKARLCAQGFTQIEGVDYTLTYAPVMGYTTLRILLSIATILDYDLFQIDVITAFLNAILDEEIYMKQPEGFHKGSKSKVCRLWKSLYGTKQAPYLWNDLLNCYLISQGWTPTISDPCVYFKISFTGRTMFIGVFVDDCIIGIHPLDHEEYLSFKKAFMIRFKSTDLGECKWILGMKVVRDRMKRTLFLSQKLYFDKVLASFNLTDCKSVSTPQDAGLKLSNIKVRLVTDIDYIEMSKRMELLPYRRVVGSLLYAAISTRPDLAHVVQILSRYLTNYTEEHWLIAKHALRYLAGTTGYGLLYTDDGTTTIHATAIAHATRFTTTPTTTTPTMSLISMSDSNYGGTSESVSGNILTDCKSTSGMLVSIGTSNNPAKTLGNLVWWGSKVQDTVVAQSSCEAEYYSANITANRMLWVNSFLSELHYPQTVPSLLYVDNQAAISVASSSYSGRKLNHVAIPWHNLKTLVINKQIRLEWIDTKSQLADILTKALKPQLFIELRDKLVSII